MFKHILLPTDGSDLSLRAAKLGIELAKTCGARVYALHVVAPYHTVAYMAEILAATEITYTQDATARAEKYLAEVRHMAEEAGLACSTDYVFDDRRIRSRVDLVAALAGHPCGLRALAHISQVAFGIGDGFLGVGRLVGHDEFGEIDGRGKRRDHVERIHACSEPGGQLDAGVDGTQGKFGTVGGQQDVLEHRDSSWLGMISGRYSRHR